MSRYIQFTVEAADIFDFTADVIAFKFAREPHGADRKVRERLLDKGVAKTELEPNIGEAKLIFSRDSVKAKRVLLVGTVSLTEFDSPKIRRWAEGVLQAIQEQAQATTHIAMTVHGLDAYYPIPAHEAFLAQFIALLTAIYQGRISPRLEHVTIVEKDEYRAQELRLILKDFVANSPDIKKVTNGIRIPVGASDQPGKRRVFVAMSFDDDMYDHFFFGIQWPILAAGCRCDRVDHVGFYAGDIIAKIEAHLRNAHLVLADLNQLKPNVFLEAGYAWGLRKDMILLVPHEYIAAKKVPFDVQTYRHVAYKDDGDLRGSLTQELAMFLARVGQETGPDMPMNSDQSTISEPVA